MGLHPPSASPSESLGQIGCGIGPNLKDIQKRIGIVVTNQNNLRMGERGFTSDPWKRLVQEIRRVQAFRLLFGFRRCRKHYRPLGPKNLSVFNL